MRIHLPFPMYPLVLDTRFDKISQSEGKIYIFQLQCGPKNESEPEITFGECGIRPSLDHPMKHGKYVSSTCPFATGTMEGSVLSSLDCALSAPLGIVSATDRCSKAKAVHRALASPYV